LASSAGIWAGKLRRVRVRADLGIAGVAFFPGHAFLASNRMARQSMGGDCR